MEPNLGELTQNHFLAFNAISCWHSVLHRITDHLEETCHDASYAIFIANANALVNPNMERDIQKAIHDFYDYFYTNQHIADFNHHDYDLFTNDYVKLANVFASAAKRETNLLREVTFYVFDLILSLRESLQLPRLEREPHDQYIVKYYTRYYGENGKK